MTENHTRGYRNAQERQIDTHRGSYGGGAHLIYWIDASQKIPYIPKIINLVFSTVVITQLKLKSRLNLVQSYPSINYVIEKNLQG